MSPELEAALERARQHKMTPQERFEQRVSFVYAQQNFDKPNALTKDEVRQALTDPDGFWGPRLKR